MQNFLELGCVPEQNSELNSPTTLENMQNTMVDDKNNEPEVYDTAGKKRGRKPRGGKLIVKQPETAN